MHKTAFSGLNLSRLELRAPENSDGAAGSSGAEVCEGWSCESLLSRALGSRNAPASAIEILSCLNTGPDTMMAAAASLNVSEEKLLTGEIVSRLRATRLHIAVLREVQLLARFLERHSQITEESRQSLPGSVRSLSRLVVDFSREGIISQAAGASAKSSYFDRFADLERAAAGITREESEYSCQGLSLRELLNHRVNTEIFAVTLANVSVWDLRTGSLAGLVPEQLKPDLKRAQEILKNLPGGRAFENSVSEAGE